MNFLYMGIAKGIPLAYFRRVLRIDRSVEGNLGSGTFLDKGEVCPHTLYAKNKVR